MRPVSTCAFAIVSLLGCGPAATVDFTFSADRQTFDGRSQRAIVSVVAVDEKGAPGTGIVELTSGVGTFVEGSQIALVAGEGSATFRCNPGDDSACAGQVRLGATWRGQSRSFTLRVTPSDPSTHPLWRVVPTLQPVTLYAAAVTPSGTVWAVGQNGTLMPFVNGAWGAPVPTGVTSTLRSIVIDAAGVITIVGDQGVVLSGRPDALQPVQHTLTDDLSAVLWHDQRLYVATRSGVLARYDTNDFETSQVSTLPFNSLVRHGAQFVAAGDEGLFGSSDGQTWARVETPVLARWLEVHSDADGLWALGRRSTLASEPILIRGPGPDWKSTSLPTGGVQAMSWGTGSADRWVVTDTSVFRQQVGSAWEDLEAPSGGNAIVQLGGTSVLVIGPPGVSILRIR